MSDEILINKEERLQRVQFLFADFLIDYRIDSKFDCVDFDIMLLCLPGIICYVISADTQCFVKSGPLCILVITFLGVVQF